MNERRDANGLPEKEITRRRVLDLGAKTALAATAAGALPALLTRCADSSKYDVIVRGAEVLDGSGSKAFAADIGIRGDKIITVGKCDGPAKIVIDAKGLTVTPGFIDVHTHCDLTFQRTGSKRHMARVMPSWKGNYNYLYQGVTTVVTGNCGYGYTDADKWFGILRSLDFGSNVAHLAPHGAMREELFGKKPLKDLSRAQLELFKSRVSEEMDKGVVGFSTGLAYAPGIDAGTAELIEIAKVVGKKGGVYATHIRNESGEKYQNGKVAVVESVLEAIEIGKRGGLPVEISHFKISAPINGLDPRRILEPIEKARKEGLDITADQYPYDAGSTRITFLLPHEFVTSDSIKDEYKTGEGRKKVKAAIEKTFAYIPPEKTLISMYPEKEEYEGKNIKEIAEMAGKSASDCYVEMVCEKTAPYGVLFLMDIEIVKRLMPYDYIITASDSATVPKGFTRPHPRTYGTFPRKIRQYALEEKILSLPAAIRSMTSLPADKFGLKGRGRIAEGGFADIAVLNLKTIADRSTYLDPHQYATGVEYLLVNGRLAIEKGKATGDRGGRVLLRA